MIKQMKRTKELRLLAPEPERHAEAIYDLLAKVFHLKDYYFGRDWCREHYIGHSHYDWQATRIGLFGEEIVTHYGVWDYQMRIGGARVRTGGIGAVATSGDYRKLGLMAQTAQASIAAMRARGYDFTLLFGIDNFYGKLGYVRAWPEITYTVNVADLPLDSPQVSPRLFTIRHRADLAELYNRTFATVTGTAVRPTYRRCFLTPLPKGMRWDHTDGTPAGYLIYRQDGARLKHVESVGDVDEVLRLLGMLARRNGCQEVQFCDLPYTSPLCARLRRGNCRAETNYRRDGGPLICLLNLTQVLEKMAGELTDRLQASLLAGWKGNLRIAGAGQDAMLAITGGQVRIAPAAPTRHTVEGGNEIAQLLIGAAPPNEIVSSAGMRLTGDAARLLDVLFPAQHPVLLTLDRI